MANYSNDMSSMKERYEKEKQKRDLRNYLVSFAMMLALTLLAFAAVVWGGKQGAFVAIFILLLAVIQAAFQMLYFMHLKDKNHNFPMGFIASGATVAVLTVATLMTLIWWQ
ncbi:MAG TPA: cytochrome C oxidase subunit IV family protein [Bacillales bacterium]|nr:cytochrome C oxidase subunit IV family protein [Bacillales bacterium]